jgi:isopenicillin-N N-acyltransferase like protein
MTPTMLEIDAKGSPREIGRAIGEAARDLIHEALDFYEGHQHEMGAFTFAEAEHEALAYLPVARRRVPGVVEELEGTAEAAGVSLTRLMVPNLGEELTCNTDPAAGTCLSHGHCTTLAINAGGRRIVGHNEDWFAGDADSLLLRLTCADGTRIVAVTSPVLAPPTGISSHGIAGGANTVYANDHHIGVPNNLLRRWILESRSLEEARERCLVDERARGSNHLFGDSDGRIWNIETSATAATVVESERWYAHTNHYLAPEMGAYEISTSVNSRTRHSRACELIEEGLASGDDAAQIAARVLADHAHGADCICGHPVETDSPGEREMTVASMIWDLDELTVDVAFGPPCENERVRFALE